MMEVTMRRTEELIPYERNQKKHDEKQIRNVANSIKRFGWQQPIVIDSKDVVVIGHCRLLAAKLLELEEVPCKVIDDLSEDEIRELRIADNKTNESPWDFENLDLDIGELSFEGFDFDWQGLSTDDEEVSRDEIDIDTENFQLIIDCDSEEDMQAKYDRLQEVGIECRVSTL